MKITAPLIIGGEYLPKCPFCGSIWEFLANESYIELKINYQCIKCKRKFTITALEEKRGDLNV